MAKSKSLPQYRLLPEIRRFLYKNGHRHTSVSDIESALTRMYNQQPARFGDEESRKTLVQEISEGFLARHKKAKNQADERKTVEGEWIPFSTGYEYAILVALRLRPAILKLRDNWNLPNNKPLQTFDDAVSWLNQLNENKLPNGEKVEMENATVSFELTAERATELASFIPQQDPSSDTQDAIELDADELVDILAGADLGTLSVNQPICVLEIFPEGDFKEERGVQWKIGSDTWLAAFYAGCNAVAKLAPEWDVNKLASYVLFDRLPLLPVKLGRRGIRGGNAPVSFSIELPYPVSDDTLLRFYKGFRDQYNDLGKRLYNFDPPNLSEYQLVLLDVVHKMPLDEFAWSERLRFYLEEYSKEIKAGFLKDHGLYREGGKRDFNNAARNMGRDFKQLLKSLT